MNQDVTLIIIVFNSMHLLPQCLVAVSREIGADSEVFLIDNASEDGSADFVEKHYPAFELIRNTTNIGFAAACNQGAELARGRYLAFLNPDTVVKPGWLSMLIAPLRQTGTVGLVTSKILLMSDINRINTCGLDIHFTGLSFARGFNSLASDFRQMECVPAVSGASFAIANDLWKRLGGFDPDFFMYFEETDLCWRAQLRGFKCLFVPDSILHHHHSSKRHRLTIYYSERNRWLLLLRNWRLATLLLLVPALVVTELLTWFYVASFDRETVRAKLQGYVWLISNLGAILRSRGQIQTTRQVSDYEILSGRTPRLAPHEHTGGRLASLAIQILNRFYGLVYRGDLFLLKTLNL